ncbi:MAG: 16S rRNA (cytosine(1402)-N(4))-methyltransferase RsmH [Acidobacteriota bacterium]
MDAQHVPVLLEESLEYLAIERGGLFVDCTLGLGGHAGEILRRAPEARVLGIDRDGEALALARRRLAPFGERVRLVEGNFHDLCSLLESSGLRNGERPAGVLADLGVSSMQLDRAERGFSFRKEGPLDMRMGGTEMTAANVVNQRPEMELVRIFKEYGEEKQAKRIARAVVEARGRQPLRTTSELADLVREVKGRGARGHDPATQVFQALRIEVNEELSRLRRFIDEAVRLVDQDGRLVVISYHSLEDRIVKHGLRDLDRGQVDQVTGRPLAETRLIEVLTKKPVRPGGQEIALNPRSRSARLRAARRI